MAKDFVLLVMNIMKDHVNNFLVRAYKEFLITMGSIIAQQVQIIPELEITVTADKFLGFRPVVQNYVGMLNCLLVPKSL